MITLKPLLWTKPLKGVSAFQTTRGQANPRNPYSEYNLCDYTGDDALRVLNARIELCSVLGIDMDHLVMPRQVHGNNIAVIDQDFMDADIDAQEKRLEGVDALITTLPSVCIGVNTADCVNIALCDPSAHIIAIAHAGWRGAASRIALDVVNAMERMGAKAENILTTMGASICQDCFEVGDEVVDAFARSNHDIHRIMQRNPATGKAHIHLQQACSLTLQEAGVPLSHIIWDGDCSRCKSNTFFSARRLGINSGRTFTGIILNS